jgi:hypothetical protein
MVSFACWKQFQQVFFAYCIPAYRFLAAAVRADAETVFKWDQME